jgi:hypothetical protein
MNQITQITAGEITDEIYLTDGSILRTWSGQACYSCPDEAKGRVEIGATLVDTKQDVDSRGREFTTYTFA